MINWTIDVHMKSLTFGFCFLIKKQIESCHVAMRLFSNRSQKASKCGKITTDALGYLLVCHVFGVPVSALSVIDYKHMATWNIFDKYLTTYG